MQQLTGLDAAFLALDSPTAYGHVGSVSVLEPPAGGEALTVERLTELIESRLPLAPLFRRRLVEVPFGLDQPYWIEDPDFDIEFHVRELALPAPGDDRQLAIQAARLHARPLDRRRPLWETYLIHGLQGGRQAVYVKVHHAAIDGVSGNDLLASLMDTSPEPRDVGEPDSWRPEDRARSGAAAGAQRCVAGDQPGSGRAGVGGDRALLPALVSSPARPWLPLVDRFLLRRDRGVVLSAPPLIAPATPFNKNIGPHRRWAFASVPLAEVKAIKNAAGVTVNDVVMALCAGALRVWLQKHDVLPEGPLVAAVPVSIRTEEQKGTHGNRVSSVIAALPTHLADPAGRLAAVHEAMRAAKEQHNALPAELLTDIAEFSMPALANQANRWPPDCGYWSGCRRST